MPSMTTSGSVAAAANMPCPGRISTRRSPRASASRSQAAGLRSPSSSATTCSPKNRVDISLNMPTGSRTVDSTDRARECVCTTAVVSGRRRRIARAMAAARETESGSVSGPAPVSGSSVMMSCGRTSSAAPDGVHSTELSPAFRAASRPKVALPAPSRDSMRRPAARNSRSVASSVMGFPAQAGASR